MGKPAGSVSLFNNARYPVSHSGPGLRKRLRGFTVIELMIVVVIAVVLIGLAGPDFRQLIVATRIKNTSFDIFASLVRARSEAITRNTTVTLTPVGGDWANGWTITCSDATTCVDPVTTTPPLTLATQNAAQGITISGAPSTLSFNGMGRTTAAASFTVTAANATDENKRCVTLDASGRPLTKPVVKSGFSCP